MKGAADYDFILAFVIFLSVYLAIFNIMPFFTISSSEAKDNLILEADYLSDSLVKSSGEPHNWNITNVEKLGLAYYDTTSRPNVLDYRKLQEINSTDCRNLIPMTETTVNFHIRVETRDYSINCSNEISERARLIERTAVVNNNGIYKSAKLKLYVWEP